MKVKAYNQMSGMYYTTAYTLCRDSNQATVFDLEDTSNKYIVRNQFTKLRNVRLIYQW